MSWINRRMSALFSRDFLIMLKITFILFLVVNLLFVYFSPLIIPKLPSDFVRAVSGCYRTLYHFGDALLDENAKYEIVHGDSYSEGSGDEFLSRDSNYGIFRKLSPHVDRSFMVFGRSGFGNIRTVIEEDRCAPLLTRFTSFDYDEAQIERITFVFYEGNDLKNNLRELKGTSSNFKDTLRFFVPLFDYAIGKIDDGVKQIESWVTSEAATDINADVNMLPFPVSDSGVEIGRYPQAAPVEFTSAELETSLDVLRTSLDSIQTAHPDKRLQFLYLPSVASSYSFSGDLPVQGYKGGQDFVSTGRGSRALSDDIRGRIQNMASSTGWEFCDVTNDIQSMSSAGVAVHGPLDWKHFNKDGYTTVKNSYLACFGNEE